MNLRAILFDRDGTLTDFNKTWGLAMYHMLRELADGKDELARELAELSLFDFDRHIFMQGSPILVNTADIYTKPWAERLGIEGGKPFVDYVEDLLVGHAVECVSPFDDTIPSVRTISEAGYKIGLATNGTESSALAQLKKVGMLDHFCFVAGYDSGYGGKPEPGQLLSFARHVGCEPHEVAMVGDSLHDMHAAEKAGMVRVAVTTGALTRDELQGSCDYLLDNLTDLVNLLGLNDERAVAAS